MTRLNRTKGLMRRVRQIVLVRDGTVIDTNPVDGQILIMYSRVISLYEGVTVLLDARLAPEATILSREMYTDSLHLMELASRESDRASLILRILSDSLTAWEEMNSMAQSVGEIAENDVKLLDHVEKKRKELETYQRSHGVGRLESFQTERPLATTHGRLDDFMGFQLAHRVVHQPIIAQLGRTKTEPGKMRIHHHEPDDDRVAAVGVFAMPSALHAHKAVASIFGWTDTPPEQIDSLLAEVRDVFANGSHDER